MSKEIKKKSTKEKYCLFEGIVKRVPQKQSINSNIRCPECNRKMEASVNIVCGDKLLTLSKHRRNK